MKKGLLILFLGVVTLLSSACTNNSEQDESSYTKETSTIITSERKSLLSVSTPAYSMDESTFTIKGSSSANSKVSLLFEGKETASVDSNEDGFFEYTGSLPQTKDLSYTVSNNDETLSIFVKSKKTLENEKLSTEELASKKAEEDKIAADKKAEEEQLTAEKKAAEEQTLNEQKAKEEEAKRIANERATIISNATREQKNALNKAKDYLEYTAFSKSSLYEQLIFEQFPADAAQFAIDNIQVDWNAQALEKAKDYLAYSSFSDQGLTDQLIHEGFTTEQAQYAINNLPK